MTGCAAWPGSKASPASRSSWSPWRTSWWLELSSSRAVRVLTRAMVDGKPAGRIAEIVDGVQQDAETADRERRGMLREFEQVESDQREQLYARRQDIFSSGDPRKQALETIDEVVGWNAAAYEDPEDLHGALSQLYPVTLSAAELGASKPGATGTDRLILTERIRNDARHAFETREKEVSQEAMGAGRAAGDADGHR